MRDYSSNRSKYRRSKYNNYQNRSRDSSQNMNSSYSNRQKNYSQSPHRNNTRYQNSQQIYRSSTPKHQSQLIQVQTTEETQSDPPGIDNNKSTELQLNNINCESTDSESDTDNANSNNLIHVEKYYKPIIYEQPIYSQIYQNHDQFLLTYYTKPISSNKTKEKIIEEKTEEKPTECSNTNDIYQNIPKEPHSPNKKSGQSHFF